MAQFCIQRSQAVLFLVLLAALFAPVVVASPGEYRIAPGDLISITVFGEEDLSLERVRVAANGMVSFPLLGEVQVRNYTARGLEIRLTNLLRDGYLKKPKVTVSVLEYRPFYIKGGVKGTGAYPYQQGMTVEKALTLAGGFTADAAESKITIVRENSLSPEPIPADLTTAVLPGDIINVGTAEVAGTYFYMYGEVRKPGSYKYREGLTVEKAIVLAGGFGARASKRKITLARESEAGTERFRVKLNTPIEPGDVITVGQSLF